MDPTVVMGVNGNPTHTLTQTLTTPNSYLTPYVAIFNFTPTLIHLMAYYPNITTLMPKASWFGRPITALLPKTPVGSTILRL